MTLPIWVWLTFFIFMPLGVIAWYSFGYKPDMFTTIAVDHLSFDRYVQATTGVFVKTFWNTLRIALTGTILCALISIPFSYWTAVKANPKYRGLLIALVLVPYWTNFLVRTLGWEIMLSKDGFISNLLQWAHVLSGPLDILYTRTAVQIGVVYNYLPLMILPLYVAFERTDPALREASRDLGAGRLRTFLSITMPQAMPGLLAGSLLVFVPLMGDYITATILGGARGNMVGQMVAIQFEQGQDWALGSAMAFVLIGFTIATVLISAVVILLLRAIVRRIRRVDLARALA
jgi:spermidine/putrescine transport system permease protein